MARLGKPMRARNSPWRKLPLARAKTRKRRRNRLDHSCSHCEVEQHNLPLSFPHVYMYTAVCPFSMNVLQNRSFIHVQSLHLIVLWQYHCCHSAACSTLTSFCAVQCNALQCYSFATCSALEYRGKGACTDYTLQVVQQLTSVMLLTHQKKIEYCNKVYFA